MHLARNLAFITATFNFHIMAAHIKGVHSIWTDALSHDILHLFHSLHLQANQEKVIVHQPLFNPLTLSKPDWTSRGGQSCGPQLSEWLSIINSEKLQFSKKW